MKSFVAVIAVAVLGVTGLCHADDQRNFEALSVEPVGADQPSAVTPQSEDVGAPSRALKAVLYEVSREPTIQKRFVGSTVWRTDAIGSSAEPSARHVISADVEIPSR